MKLEGYLSEGKEFVFANPIYSDQKNNYYSHKINKGQTIISFKEIKIDIDKIKKIHFKNSFSVNKSPALIFIGKQELVFCNQSEKIIDDILEYINQNQKLVIDKVKNEAEMIKKIAF
jgi:hypothetical protein